MAFYAQSEEARQSHSVQKLALGALALEDALSKGLPIQDEIEALRPHLEGVDDDSLIALVLSSLPEESQKYGTDTLTQLNHKAKVMSIPFGSIQCCPSFPSGQHTMLHLLPKTGSIQRCYFCPKWAAYKASLAARNGQQLS
ncbi:hypothetical protein F511_34656 [Dorcoceras hygrometricum]|uniref:Uncharacterized protein n=1 Tax=Dorcoceras hygrometricum TaxID=472368 RepID=A0A2Z7C4C2_9LAMI|nr:hypothetical protein F511_34656 [Dorcoceras hygrometricum]